MRIAVLASLLIFSSQAPAAVLNVEFNFAPFTGDPKDPKVVTVPGKATVYVNNVPLAEDTVEKKEVPVLFDNREIAGALWITAASLGPALRKGPNKVRVEFEPADAKAPYRTQFRWATVTDGVSTSRTPSGATQQTNQADAGVEYKSGPGKIVHEREFVADFATALPWHKYPAVTSLSDEDKKRLASLLQQRAEAFKPAFADAYQRLKGNKNVNVAEVQKARCLDAAYAAGVRVVVRPLADLDFATTGNPEVVVSSRKGELYPVDPKAFERIKGNDNQMCAGVMLSLLYPPRVAVVRNPSGEWEVAY